MCLLTRLERRGDDFGEQEGGGRSKSRSAEKSRKWDWATVGKYREADGGAGVGECDYAEFLVSQLSLLAILNAGDTVLHHDTTARSRMDTIPKGTKVACVLPFPSNSFDPRLTTAYPPPHRAHRGAR